jgi:hypothetical protein
LYKLQQFIELVWQYEFMTIQAHGRVIQSNTNHDEWVLFADSIDNYSVSIKTLTNETFESLLQ